MNDLDRAIIFINARLFAIEQALIAGDEEREKKYQGLFEKHVQDTIASLQKQAEEEATPTIIT